MKKNINVWIWVKSDLPGMILFSFLLGFCLSLIIIPSNYLINNKPLLISINFATSLTTFIVAALWFPKFNQFIKKRILRINVPPQDLVETYIDRISTSLDCENIAALLLESVLPSFLIHTSALVWIEEELSTIFYFDGIAKDSIPTTAELLSHDSNQQVIFTPYPINNHEYGWIQLILPLKINKKTIGFWCLGSKDPDDIYKGEEIKILKSIAGQTAIALAKIQDKERVDFLLQENIHRHEKERSKLARDLHDEVLNGLVVLGLTLEDNQISPEFEKHYKSLTERIRRMINGLRPPSLKHGLWYALEEKTEEMRQLTGNRINIEFNIRNSSVRYHPSIEGHLFRIIQQALDNAIQHSIADNIRVFGALNPDSILLGVEDDGIGLHPQEDGYLEYQSGKNHYGMTVMKERAELIDAELNLISEAGRGTRVEVILNGILHKQDEQQARIKAEKSLKEREDSLKDLLDSASYGILIIDEFENFIYANPQAVNISGYSSPKLLQLTMKDLVPSEEYQKITEWRQSQKESHPPQPLIETRIKDKNGEIVHLEMTIGKIIWNGKQAAMALFNNISTKKQIEDSLKESEDTLNRILENAKEGIVIVDQLGNHVYVNKNFSDLTGYSVPELTQKNMQDMLVGYAPALQKKLADRFSKAKAPAPYETSIRKKNGIIIPIVGVSIQTTWQGQMAVMAFFQDISALRLAEEALRQSEEKFKAIVDNANDGILVVDGSGKHIYANLRAAEITGYHIDELLETSIVDLAHPENFEEISGRFQSRIADVSIPSQHETRILSKDGTQVHIEYTSAKISWGGQPAVMVIIRDISERKRSEEILRNSEIKFKAIVDTSNDGIMVGDEDGKHIYANARAAEITGYSIEELLNSTLKDLVHPDEFEGITKISNVRISGGDAPRQYKTRLVSKNGGEIPVEITAERTSWNQQNAIIMTFRDIS